MSELQSSLPQTPVSNDQAGAFSAVLMGDESLLIHCGSALMEREHTIAAVATGSPTVSTWAVDHGIPVLEPGSTLETQLAHTQFDWFLSIANLRLVPEGVWRKARKGAVNFHDGPLPAYAGLNAPSWALLAGETTYGVAWHEMTAGIDEGRILAQASIDIDDDETALTLNTKCLQAGADAFLQLLEHIEGDRLEGTSQDSEARTYFSKHQRPDAAGTIDFEKPADEIAQFVRALDFGDSYRNPLCLPKIKIHDNVYCVRALDICTEERPGEPGRVLAHENDHVLIGTATTPVRVSRLIDKNGSSCAAQQVLKTGDSVQRLSPHERDALSALNGKIVQHEDHFEDVLTGYQGLALDGLMPATQASQSRWNDRRFKLPGSLTGEHAITAIVSYFARVSGHDRIDFAYTSDEIAGVTAPFSTYFVETVPLSAEVDDACTCEMLHVAVRETLSQLHARTSYPCDLVCRIPELREPISDVAFTLTDGPDQATPYAASAITFVVPKRNEMLVLHYDETRFPAAEVDALLSRLDAACITLHADRQTLVRDLPLMTEEDAATMLVARNATETVYDRNASIHQLIEQQCARTPEATALVFEDQELTCSSLKERSDRIALALCDMGVKPGDLVGLYLPRSIDLVVGALAILKSGAAYVPLDPHYPDNRIELMIKDSGLSVVLSNVAISDRVPSRDVTVAAIEDVEAFTADTKSSLPTTSPDSLAYVIYTSGSTGHPKGVMVEHRNVVNFFSGMDQRISHEEETQPVWLAVTSLSFDISVLELFWTLSRGYNVVIQGQDSAAASTTDTAVGKMPAGSAMDFGLFYWGNDDGPGPKKYQLLLDGARFADKHGFTSIWTPERHFHAFGGPYPNPAVTGAAVAAITENLSIRAGSCVLPLHHPARVAEEWGVIDNISNGRVAIAFASGWMPEDFLLRPENAPPNNKASMFRDIDVVRRLWRGEKVAFDAPGDKTVEVTTLPRPVQDELPVWVTTAGNADTFREAARHGANVLTHLLGQTIDEMAEKIEIYRATLAECGFNPDDHKVTLMLHTLVGADREEVRDLARQPMKDYLRSAVGLIKQYAWAFPAFKRPKDANTPFDLDLQSLDADEMDAILEFAFLRYFDDSGLFGTVDDAIARAHQLTAIGVDEIACLIDFGVEFNVVMPSLQPLAEVVLATRTQASGTDTASTSYGFADLVARHGVTHMQCTPAMAKMLLMSDADKTALGNIRHLFIGGEAFPGNLVAELRAATDATLENMYGPTETTIWSSTQAAHDCNGAVPLGTPIANTQLYVLDDRMRLQPDGLTGELYIGGDGVARGYHNQPDLTDERFVPDPFRDNAASARLYRTGDLVRYGHDGSLQFLGRSDHQVKIRGHRIELGEIEAALTGIDAVDEAVVIAREDTPGDIRIAAYLRYKSAQVSDHNLRSELRTSLPEFMIPAQFVTLSQFPLTPNAKVDRKALPRPEDVVSKTIEIEFQAPGSDVEVQIAEAFKRVLGTKRIGLRDNFFDLGGHSLLAVQLHRDLKAGIGATLSITDIYRSPTVAGLSALVSDHDKPDESLGRVAKRAAARRNARSGRRQALAQAREGS